MRTAGKLYVYAGILGLCGLLVAAWYGLRPGAGAGRDPLERAVLAENWPEVKTLCGNDADAQLAAYLRALKAHACLALNHNDESLALFLSIANNEDLSAWRDWASKFAEDNPRSAVALYLKGDSLARLGNWEGAAEAYTQALGKTKTPLARAMVLNARGVALVYCGKHQDALGDLENACAAAPGFADGHASLGTLLVLTEAPDGAIQHYDAALKEAEQKFALASNGRGCARIGSGRNQDLLDQAMEDLAASLKCPHTKNLTQSNIQKILDNCREEVEGGQKKPTAGVTTVVEKMHFRDFNNLDPATQRQLASKMTPGQFQRITNEYSGHQKAIDVGKTMYTGLDKVGVGFNLNVDSGKARIGVRGGADASGIRFEQHLDRQQSVNAKTMSTLVNAYTGSHKGAGGADTTDVALDKSSGDTGPWLAKNTWFGLIPGSDLPRLAPSGL